MDEEQFEDICRVIGVAMPRRGVVGALGGLLGMAFTTAAAGNGAFDGRLGGRHGSNRRGRKSRRNHRDKRQRSSPGRKAGGAGSTSPSAACTSIFEAAGCENPELPQCSNVSDLGNKNLSGCDVSRGIFQGALEGTNFSQAIMEGTTLTVTILDRVRLDGARLNGANFTDAFFLNMDLRKVDLSGAILTGVHWTGVICPDGTNSDANENTCCGHMNGVKPVGC